MEFDILYKSNLILM